MADETPPPDDDAPSAADTFETGAADTGGAAERVLNQEEIDSLLGFDVGSDQAQDKIRRPRHHQFGAGVL